MRCSSVGRTIRRRPVLSVALAFLFTGATAVPIYAATSPAPNASFSVAAVAAIFALSAGVASLALPRLLPDRPGDAAFGSWALAISAPTMASFLSGYGVSGWIVAVTYLEAAVLIIVGVVSIRRSDERARYHI